MTFNVAASPIVSAARWMDAEHRSIVATIDGATIYVPDDPANSDRRAIAQWERAGNTIVDLPTPTLAELKTQKLAALADRRWRAEVAGTITNGFSLPTDEKTQAKLTAAVVASMLDNNYSVQWKLADGTFATLDHASLIAVAQGGRAHVQGCFDHEAALAAEIAAAADAAALDAVDIEAGWPVSLS